MILDLKLPDMSGFELLDEDPARSSLREMPIVVFTGRELSEERREPSCASSAKSIVLKGVQIAGAAAR